MAFCARKSRPGPCSRWCRTWVRCAVWIPSPAPAWRRPLATRRASPQPPTSWPTSAWCHRDISRLKCCIGAITKSGDIHARTLLIEAAHSYRFPARITRRQLAGVDAVPEAVREIGAEGANLLCQRDPVHEGKGQADPPVIVTAIARELAGSRCPSPASRRIPANRRCHDKRRPGSSNRVEQAANAARYVNGRRRPLGAGRHARTRQTGAPIQLRHVTVRHPHPVEETGGSTPLRRRGGRQLYRLKGTPE